MAKNEPELHLKCPRCGEKAIMEIDIDMKLHSNVTVLDCPNEECEYRFAKDQSVKLSGNLVLQAADAMDIVGGYSSLGEFIREAVRGRTQMIQNHYASVGFAEMMGLIADDPETWLPILKGEHDQGESE